MTKAARRSPSKVPCVHVCGAALAGPAGGHFGVGNLEPPDAFKTDCQQFRNEPLEQFRVLHEQHLEQGVGLKRVLKFGHYGVPYTGIIPYVRSDCNSPPPVRNAANNPTPR